MDRHVTIYLEAIGTAHAGGEKHCMGRHLNTPGSKPFVSCKSGGGHASITP